MLEHVTQAKHNEIFASSFDISSTPYRDWIITGLFYSAVHYIEAALDKFGKHSQIHSQRNTFMQTHLKNNDIFDDHRDLYEFSRNARYNCKIMTEDDIQECKDTLNDLKQKIRHYVAPVII